MKKRVIKFLSVGTGVVFLLVGCGKVENKISFPITSAKFYADAWFSKKCEPYGNDIHLHEIHPALTGTVHLYYNLELDFEDHEDTLRGRVKIHFYLLNDVRRDRCSDSRKVGELEMELEGLFVRETTTWPRNLNEVVSLFSNFKEKAKRFNASMKVLSVRARIFHRSRNGSNYELGLVISEFFGKDRVCGLDKNQWHEALYDKRYPGRSNRGKRVQGFVDVPGRYCSWRSYSHRLPGLGNFPYYYNLYNNNIFLGKYISYPIGSRPTKVHYDTQSFILNRK